MTEVIQVVTTAASQADARVIARHLVEHRLAACVQVVGPIESTYWWQGQLETAEEWQCIVKTMLDRYAAVEEAITEVHPYDTPEILATRVERGSRSYLEWLRAELNAGDAPETFSS